MRVFVRQVGGVTILDLKGKITIGVGDVVLRDSVDEALRAGVTNLALNLEEVTTIDNSGIGELVASYTTLSKRGGKLRLFGISPKVEDILQITQLVTVFDIFDNEKEALDSF